MKVRVERDTDPRLGQARRRMSPSSQRLMPVSATWITSEPASVSNLAAERGKP